jgi:hypothetical protein
MTSGHSKPMRSIRLRPAAALAALAMLLAAAPSPARAQDNQGPMAPPPKFEVKRLSSEPHPGPPPIPEQEIIQKFAASETIAKKIYDAYSFTQTVRIEEKSDTGGKFTAVGEVYSRPDGQRYWKAVKPIESDLKLTNFTMADVHMIANLPLFFLTTDDIGNYTFVYAGDDKLDALHTYVFQVKPKMLSRTKRYFEGAIWIDDQDLAIVKTFGKFVGEIAGNGTNLPFNRYEIYRENFQQKYWLPTYAISDEYLDQKDESQLHLRLVVRDEDFKFTPVTDSAPPAPASTASPTSPNAPPATSSPAPTPASPNEAPKPQAPAAPAPHTH